MATLELNVAAKKAEKLLAVKGMNDILPGTVSRKEKLPTSAIWHWFDGVVREVLARYGYQYIVTPVVEPTQLFVRGLGEVTDIVEKEMYSFTDSMNGDKLTLRPEATAGIVRAVVQHNALYNGPLRIWTMGPMFRHERPQKGRYRQFHQLDVEALGFAGPDVDAELILMGRALLRELLEAAGQPYRINPRLVRGLDYYNRTVFEWTTDHLGSQGTICGGGRYD